MHHSMQRNTNMRKHGILSAFALLALAACGGTDDAFQGGGPGGGGTSAQVASLTLVTSAPSIPSDGSSPATISAFARNANNQFVEGAAVLFSASSGGLQITNPTTNSNGLASATLTSAGDPTNRSITVTAMAGNVTATANVAVSGTTLVLQGPQALALSQQGTFSATLRDAGNDPIPGRTLQITSQRTNTLSTGSVTTDANGQATFTVTIANSGDDTITVQGLGLVATQIVAVNSDSFRFTSPNPNTEVNLGVSQNVSLTWTVNGTPQAGQTINFSTTRGTVTASAVTNGSGVATAAVSATNAGGAVVTASSGANSATLPIEFVAVTPASIDAQPSSFSIATGQSSTITAVVRDAAGNLVKNRVVSFTLTDVTGGTLSVGAATTDSQGRAQTVYTASNTTSANQGVLITSTVNGTAISDTVALTVARREVFISIGTGNEIAEPNTAQYDVEYVVQVTDANGNGVPNVPVSMRLLSVEYFKGWRVDGRLLTPQVNGWLTNYALTNLTSPVGAGCADEDLDRDGTLDTGEDFNTNGRIEAGNIASVSPANVQTDANGWALVHVRYPQEYAYYLTVDLSASTTVQGTEYVRTSRFMLEGTVDDFRSTGGPPGPVSPFGRAATCSNPN